MLKTASLALLLLLSVQTVAEAKISWMEAESLVKNLRCSSGGTVEQCLNKKASIKAIEDLDWHVYPRNDGFEVERLMLKWHHAVKIQMACHFRR